MRSENLHDCYECRYCDFRVYDKYSPEEPYCLIHKRFLVDMGDYHGVCYNFEQLEEDTDSD